MEKRCPFTYCTVSRSIIDESSNTRQLKGLLSKELLR